MGKTDQNTQTGRYKKPTKYSKRTGFALAPETPDRFLKLSKFAPRKIIVKNGVYPPLPQMEKIFFVRKKPAEWPIESPGPPRSASYLFQR